MNKYTTCEISDSLLKLGVPSGGYIPDLQCFSTPSPPLFGPVFPVTMVPFADTKSPRPSQHFVDAAPLGSIILISAPPDAKNSCWGGLMTLGAKHGRQAKGVVVLGRVRDLAEHRAEAFPVYAYGHSTLPQAPFTRPSRLNEPITLPVPHVNLTPQPFGRDETPTPAPTLTIHSGDFLLADADGVVVVPKGLVPEVIKGAEERRRIDALCEEDLRKGKRIEETFRDRRRK